MSTEPDWLTAADAADRLGVSESTALSDAKAGRLRSRDRGRGKRPRWVISRQHVEELLRAGGRRDRRAEVRTQRLVGATAVDADVQAELDAANRRITQLEAEVARLRVVARNANVAVQTQTESLQQYLLEDHA